MSKTSNKDHRCVICKHLDMMHSDNLNFNFVYGEHGNPIRVLLCRRHEVELFKGGQKKFFLNYYRILLDVVNSDEVEFMKLFEKTVRSNLDKIY